MGALLDFSNRLEAITCPNCGINFGMPMHYVQTRREDKKTFHCPNGHAQSYTESEADRLKRELAEKERLLQLAREERDRQRARADQRWKTLRQTQGKMNALKKRISHGVCPQCNRTFQNLMRHMQTKHPSFAKHTHDIEKDE